MTNPCTRWMALSDREALGEVLEASERAFCAEHVAGCAECTREHALYRELATLIDPAPAVLPARSMRRTWAGALAGLAVAAALLLAVILPDRPTRAWVSEGAALEVNGSLLQAGDELAMGARAVARGRSCLKVEPGVSACFAAGSSLRAIRLDARERRLELLEGKVLATLEPQPAGGSFGIVTREGSAVAVGTVFSVEVPAHGEVVTRVLHGVVAVTNRAGEERRLGAHRQMGMSGPTSELPALDEQRELALRAVAPEAASASLEAVTPAPPTPALATPETPPVITKRVQPSPTRAAAEARPALLPAKEPLRMEAARPVENSAREEPAAPAEVPATEVSTAAQPPAPEATPAARAELSPRQLLLEARAHTAGDPSRARELYRQLFASAADSAEAKVALVPYGELLLADGQARAALRAFEHYLRLRGPLVEEASYGRIRALRAVHDTHAEQRAVDAFLREYPASVLAPSLRMGEER
jgi:hypothetical protein